MIQVMGFQIHIVVYGKKRGGDEHPAAQFFIYYNLSLRFQVVEIDNSVKILRKVFFGGVRGGGSIYLSMRHVRSFTPAMLSAIQSFKDISSHSFKKRLFQQS